MIKDQAIALRRISSIGQADGHSLEAQQTSTVREARILGVELVKCWDEIQSSRKGKNFGRRDMEEMLRFCKQNKRVGFLLIDFMNRLMREVEVMIYYKVQFNQLGVELQFCDSSQQHLNGRDQYAQLMLLIEGYKAEQDNQARYEVTQSRMKSRYEAGYYLSHPHPGYVKSDVAGIHIPDLERFDVLRRGGRLIIYKQYTVAEAVRWMNNQGYRTLGGKKLDVDHYTQFIIDRYYCGKIDIKSDGWPKDINGLHTPMFSMREHRILTAAITKRNPRVRLKYNPKFPMSNLLWHSECQEGGGYEKFTGHYFSHGKRPNGKHRAKEPVYDCRDCRKRIARKKLHDALSAYINSLEFIPSSEAFRRALLKVWRRQRGAVHQRINSLSSNRSRIEQQVRETAAYYAREPEGAAKNALRLLLEDYDAQLKSLDVELVNTQDVESESDGFVKFAFDFVESLKSKWWSLSPENKKRGEEILFNGKIYADSYANVRPSTLSTIYRLGTNKKDLGEVNFNELVELVGTAPTSAGLSWLVVYRHSSFCKS